MRATLFRKNPTNGQVSRRVFPAAVGNVVCTILSYLPPNEQRKEMDSVDFFFKPGRSCAWQIKPDGIIPIPTRWPVFHEIEVCVLIGSAPLPCPLKSPQFDPAAVRRSIAGIGLGLDWTLKNSLPLVQKTSMPWEKSKAFQHSAALTEFLDVEEEAKSSSASLLPLSSSSAAAGFPNLRFELLTNGALVEASTQETDRLKVCPLRQLWEMHQVARLEPGDVVMTGAPGIGAQPVKVGDKLTLKCEALGIDVTATLVDEADPAVHKSKL